MICLLFVFVFFLGYVVIFCVVVDVVVELFIIDKLQFQIIYNDKLREVMKWFQIMEVDMNEMLINYIESGKVFIIIKSIFNFEINLQEVKNKMRL